MTSHHILAVSQFLKINNKVNNRKKNCEVRFQAEDSQFMVHINLILYIMERFIFINNGVIRCD